MDDYELLKTALQIARQTHAGQTDKGGDDYIFHPVLVALQCAGAEAKTAALLHDTIEDSHGIVTIETLKNAGIPEEILEALTYLTHIRDESFADFHEEYRAYIRRLKDSGNEIAIAVKLADLKMNTDVRRNHGRKPPKYEDYQWALGYLQDGRA